MKVTKLGSDLAVGDRVYTWFSGADDGVSVLKEIRPYRSTVYDNNFWRGIARTGVFSAQKTRKGTLEMVIDPNGTFEVEVDG